MCYYINRYKLISKILFIFDNSFSDDLHFLIVISPTVYRTIWEELVELKSKEAKENKKQWKDLWEKYTQVDSLKTIKKEIQDNIKERAKSEQVKACPKCDSSQLSERKYQMPKYYCSNCKLS